MDQLNAVLWPLFNVLCLLYLVACETGLIILNHSKTMILQGSLEFFECFLLLTVVFSRTKPSLIRSALLFLYFLGLSIIATIFQSGRLPFGDVHYSLRSDLAKADVAFFSISVVVVQWLITAGHFLNTFENKGALSVFLRVLLFPVVISAFVKQRQEGNRSVFPSEVNQQPHENI